MRTKRKVLFIVGTRPELIKVFPIIHHFKAIEFEDFRLVSTGQHKDLLKKYWELFEVSPDYELDIMKEGQNLSNLTARAIVKIDELLENIKGEFEPNIIIAQGDTTTVMATSMVAFFNKIPYAHIEAGLRSFNLFHPFPEEFNRKVSSIVADYHFAPTLISEKNLLNEGIDKEKIQVVGNTVIDTLHYFINSGKLASHKLNENTFGGNYNDYVLVTCHRRENHTEIKVLIDAIEQLSIENPNTQFIWPVHPNPKVYNSVKSSNLITLPNVLICEPLEYLDLLKVISISKLVLTDSGGIQEEAPTFKVPVLVLRETTERPEAVNVGVSKLIGLNKAKIIRNFYSFKPKFKSDFSNPYGKGDASILISKKIGIV